jgi:hypothetical protein
MSSINPNNINGNYPVAGQDNDSQGFRDNFTNVKNNLTFAKAEIEDLQQNAILKGALAGTTLDNNLNNAILKGAQLLKTTETINDLGTLSGSVSVSWIDAHFQVLTTSGSITSLTFADWPTSGFYTKMRLWLVVANSAHTVTLSSSGVTYKGLSDIIGASGNTITFPQAGTYIFEFSTYDSGTTVSVQELTRNRSTRVTDYQYLTPANATIANVSPTVSTVIIEPAAAIDQANIRMPGNTQVVDGQTVSFAFGNTITAVTHYGNGATILGGLTSASVSTDAKYVFKTSTNTWYRVG